MRLMLAMMVLVALLAFGVSPVPAAAPSFLLAQTGAPGPVLPEQDFVRWAFTQGALTLVLVLVLFSYRRDFFRKHGAKQAEVDALREEKRVLAEILDRNGAAMLQHAVAVQTNTEATRLLAQNVNNLAERRGSHRG